MGILTVRAAIYGYSVSHLAVICGAVPVIILLGLHASGVSPDVGPLLISIMSPFVRFLRSEKEYADFLGHALVVT